MTRSCGPLSPRGKTWLALATVLPFAVLVVYVATHAVDAPWGEGWYYAQTIVIPAYDGTLKLGELYAQFMDHRIVTSKLLIVASTHLTRWDVRWHSVVAVVQAAVVFAVAVAAFARGSGCGGWPVTVPFSMLLFAVNLSTVWLRPYNDVLFPLLFLVIAARTMTAGPPRWWRLFAIAACATGATFSNGNGITAWVALVPGLWAAHYRRPGHFAVWLALCGLALAAYFADFRFSKLTAFGVPPLAVVGFAAVLLGTAISRSVPVAAAATAVGLVLATYDLWLLRRVVGCARRVSTWLVLIAHALLSALATAAGRAYLGVDFAATQPHYTVLSTSLWLGIVALSLMTLRRRHARGAVALTINVAVLAVLVPLHVATNVEAARTFVVRPLGAPYGPTPDDEACLRRTVITHSAECFHSGYWFGPQYARINDELARRRLATFARTGRVAAVLPEDYGAGDRIVVNAPLAAQHVGVTDRAGRHVAADSILRVMADDQRVLFALDAPPGARTVAAAGARASVAALTVGATRVWYLATDQDPAARRAVELGLGDGFVRGAVPLDPTRRAPLLYPVAELFERRE